MSSHDYPSPEYYAQHFRDLKRLTRILKKMRKADIPEADIKFIGAFWQRDTTHVMKLLADADSHEAEKLKVN